MGNTPVQRKGQPAAARVRRNQAGGSLVANIVIVALLALAVFFYVRTVVPPGEEGVAEAPPEVVTPAAEAMPPAASVPPEPVEMAELVAADLFLDLIALQRQGAAHLVEQGAGHHHLAGAGSVIAAGRRLALRCRGSFRFHRARCLPCGGICSINAGRIGRIAKGNGVRQWFGAVLLCRIRSVQERPARL